MASYQIHKVDKAKLYGEMILLMAFYVPPPFQTSSLVEGFNFMALHPNVPAMWLGDFNNVLDPTLDRMTSSSISNACQYQTRKICETVAGFWSG